MTHLFVVSVVLLGLIFPLQEAASDAPDFVMCKSNSACSPGYCCTIGPIRYSLPQCRPLLEEGATCRPGSASTVNTTLGYPDGTQIELTNVHYILCPCADGLSCDRKEGVCMDTSGKRDSNLLHDDTVKQDD